MTAAAASMERVPPPRPVQRPNMVAVGTIIWLSSELMFFSSLFAMFYTTRAIHLANWPPTGGPHPVHLNVPFASFFTAILLLSSLTCQWGVFAAERGDVYGLRRWFAISMFMGAIFVSGEMYEYFVENTWSISSHPYGSVYYLLTGFHMLHVSGGLIAFLVILARTTFGRFSADHATSAIVVSYYWHFVDIVWVGVFTTVYILQ